MGYEFAIEEATLGGYWVEICHQFSALLHMQLTRAKIPDWDESAGTRGVISQLS